MPRIVPIQLLKCLKVLLDDNGGILSAGEVKRLASLMTKYSKKLVSKCIYVQILKCTKTELLGEFMGAGGWSLVYTWLNDAIRAMNWPLVQEILELLLLCPVDVNRLKINSAPKLVKGLCKDGGNEGVRILAKRLVEQWLKVVTENPEATLPNSAGTATAMTPQATSIKTPPVAVVAPMVTPANIPSQTSSMVNTTSQIPSSIQQQETPIESQTKPQVAAAIKADEDEEEEEKEVEAEQEEAAAEEDCHEEEGEEEEQDPLGGVQDTTTSSYSLTPAQKKASESGLVYKIVVKNGNQFLAKVPKAPGAAADSLETQSSIKNEEDEDVEAMDDVVEENEVEEVCSVVDNKHISAEEADDNSTSLDKPEKENNTVSVNEEDLKVKSKSEDAKKSEDKKSTVEDKEKSSSSSSKDGKSLKEKERRSSSSSVDKEKDRDGKSSKYSSSSSSHRSSSHKSSSSSSSKSSSTSKSKSSSSSSSSHRGSSDKYKSEKDRSSSSKDKDRSGSSSSSKHRSSSSKSSSSSSSSSKDKYRDKEKSSSGSSSSSSKYREKDRDTSIQSDKDKNSSTSSSSSSTDKLGKIPKKSKEESSTSANNDESANKSTSINIPSKKTSMSIEIRKDTEKTKTVKTYKSQFRSHGLTEEAPPPPSRKGLKKPSSSTPTSGSILPTSLPSSLKRTSPPPRDSPTEKKAKIDINNVTVVNEKPGAIKLIPPKKIQTLVETNLFSDALSAATGPKKVAKRKRSSTPAPTGSTNAVAGKDGGPSPPTSPEVAKVMPLKFYQDTLDESKTEDSKSDKENEEHEPVQAQAPTEKPTDEDPNTDKENDNDDDDDDIPLKKVKEDIEQKVAQEKQMDLDSHVIDITKDADEKEETKANAADSPNDDASSETASDVVEIKKPGPGCGPNGPPGVLMLHRRKGPKKKLTWRPQESLEQIRFFESDENERVNVTKTSFMDMKNLDHLNERDAIVLARRGFNQEDNMEPQTNWKPLTEVDDVPPHPEGNQSKQRKIQAEREMTTLRALYFTHALIPDSPAEAEIEPIFNHDIPLIPLDDLTGNPDAVNDFTSMPWPEPRGSPKHGEISIMAGTGGLGSPVDMFGGPKIVGPGPNNGAVGYGGNPFNPIISPFSGSQGPNGPPVNNMPNNQQGPWQRTPNGMCGNGPMMGNPFNNNHGSPIMDMGGPPRSISGGPGHMMNNGPPQNFNNQFGPGNNNNNHFGGHGPMNPFVGPPTNNFGVMGPGGPMVPPHMMNGMGPGPMMGNNGPSMMNGPNNRNNGSNWRSGGGPNFQDNNGGGNGGGNWRPAGPGPNNRGGGGSSNNNNGVCKAFMRGHCRVGKSCKFIHPSKGKRI